VTATIEHKTMKSLIFVLLTVASVQAFTLDQVLSGQTAGGVITGVDYHDGMGLIPLPTTYGSKVKFCLHKGLIIQNLAEDPSKDPCQLCQCVEGELMCASQECQAPSQEGCVKIVEEGECCPKYDCDGSTDETTASSGEVDLIKTASSEIQDDDITDKAGCWMLEGFKGSSALKFKVVQGAYAIKMTNADHTALVCQETGPYQVNVTGIADAGGNFESIFLVVSGTTPLVTPLVKQKEEQSLEINLKKGDEVGIWIWGHSEEGEIKTISLCLKQLVK